MPSIWGSFLKIPARWRHFYSSLLAGRMVLCSRGVAVPAPILSLIFELPQLLAILIDELADPQAELTAEERDLLVGHVGAIKRDAPLVVGGHGGCGVRG